MSPRRGQAISHRPRSWDSARQADGRTLKPHSHALIDSGSHVMTFTVATEGQRVRALTQANVDPAAAARRAGLLGRERATSPRKRTCRM